jgi:multicomponent Na+:H+ antiporter subunit G
MSLVLDIASGLLLLAGSFAALTAAVGLVRMPDFFSRTHAVSVLDTGAVGLILLGFTLQTGLSLNTIKIALVLIFILITGPTAAHALGRSALHSGVEPLTGDQPGDQSSGS